MTIPATNTRRDSPDGFIIVALLWILGALATLVSIYAVYVMNTATTFRAHEDRLRSEALVSAALELTAYQLTETDAQSRPTHGGFDFRIGKANIAVTFQSETARIDLNAASKELLAGLFSALGASANDAANYAERIADWRTPPPQGQDSFSATQAGALRYAARGAPFPHVDELARVPGLPPALVEQALPYLTVYSGRLQVNVLEATPLVLTALPGITNDGVNELLAQRQISGDAKALLQRLGPVERFATAEGGRSSRVSVRIAFDDGRRSNSEVVILPFDEANEPYAILSWRDGSDLALDSRWE